MTLVPYLNLSFSQVVVISFRYYSSTVDLETKDGLGFGTCLVRNRYCTQHT